MSRELTYEEAVEKVKSNVVMDGYMVISSPYCAQIILTHAAGMKFINSLAKAETASSSFGNISAITTVQNKFFNFNLLSAEEYVRIKVATLLGVHPDTLVESGEEDTPF